MHQNESKSERNIDSNWEILSR